MLKNSISCERMRSKTGDSSYISKIKQSGYVSLNFDPQNLHYQRI